MSLPLVTAPASRLLAVWDCREDRWREKDAARREWLYARSLPVGRMYRTEFRLPGFHAGDPRDIMLDNLPSRELW